MKNSLVVALAASCLTLGAGIGYAAKAKGPGMSILAGKPAKDAGLAALQEAERLAENGSWELIAVGRVHYLGGDKARGQALLDKVQASGESGDWFRIARVYAEAGQNDKAAALFEKALAAEPKDDTGQSEVGAWYIRSGQREKGEALFAKAFGRNPDDFGHYVRAAEAYLNVAPN